MSNNVLKEVTSTVLPFVILGGGAFLLVKSGILGKLLSDLTGGIGKKADEIYSSVYNNKTIETIREYTNVQNVVEMVTGTKTYVPGEIVDQDGNVIDWNQRAEPVTTEGRTFISVDIPGAEQDYMMTVLGPAKSGTDKYTVKTPDHFASSKKWWQKSGFDVAGDIFDILTQKKTTYATPPAVRSSAYHSGIITPVEKTEMEPISNKQTVMDTVSKSTSKTVYTSPDGTVYKNQDVAARVAQDTQRNLDAKAANEARLAEAEKDLTGWGTTPSKSAYGGSVKHDMRTPEGKAELAAKARALHESLGGRVR